MNKTKIEWVINPDGTPGFTWNPIVGCTNGCSYCYARRLAKRFVHCQQCVDFFPHLHPERLDQPLKRKKPATIFLGSMCDLWDPNVPLAWRQKIWDVVGQTPQHTYLVLTKQPLFATEGEQLLLDFELGNLWVGVSVTTERDKERDELLDWPADRNFVSFEPLLGDVYACDYQKAYILSDWAIVGAQTGPQAKQPEEDWIKHIIDAGERSHTPVFAKDNLDWPAELGPKPRELPYLK